MIIRNKVDVKLAQAKFKNLKSEQDLEDLKSMLNDDILDIICNQCGNSCKKGDDFEGLLEVIASGGYGSEVIGDELSIRFSLCETCLQNLMKSFKHKPATRDDSIGSDFIESSKMSQNDSKVISLISKKAQK